LKSFGRTPEVIEDVSLNPSPGGEIVALLGPNGAGKTTTFQTSDWHVGARQRVHSCWDGIDITNMPFL